MARTEPRDDGAAGLVHGTLYARHILDVGDGPGVIDWHRFGQGPAELDAGMFLATLSRLRLLHESHAAEALRAEQAFLEETRGLLDERALAWHRAAALLQLTERLLTAGRPAQAGGVPVQSSRTRAGAAGALHEAGTPEELDQIRKLRGEGHDGAP